MIKIKMHFWGLVLFVGALSSCISLDQFLFDTAGKKHREQKRPPEVCIESKNVFGAGDSCLTCHNDHRKNHHPFNFVPPEVDLVNVNSNKFPLFGGKIQCFTCHTAEGQYTEGNVKLLRGGPYEDIRQLCFQCHYEEKYAEINVHNMQEENGGLRVIKGKPVCSFCHPQYINNLYSTETVEFKADVPFLCLRCHPEMSDKQIKPHFLKVPSDKIKNNITIFEAENSVILPLVPRGKISCSTCHNPHQRGVLVDSRAMAGADSSHRLRIERSKLCFACHLFRYER